MPTRRSDRSVASAALLFAALGDPTRLALVRQLADDGPASISVLAEQQAITRQGVTKHLHVLEEAGVIAGSRQGREQVWTLNPARLAAGRRHIEIIAAGWVEALDRLALLLEE